VRISARITSENGTVLKRFGETILLNDLPSSRDGQKRSQGREKEDRVTYLRNMNRCLLHAQLNGTKQTAVKASATKAGNHFHSLSASLVSNPFVNPLKTSHATPVAVTPDNPS